MGIYVNPGNLAFSRIAGKNYVDKTDLIRVMNERVGGDESLVCVSRPRRFGKSYAAKMLTAYYDCSCDSHKLFADKKIAASESYEEYLNKYNVICLDISGFVSEIRKLGGSLKSVPAMIEQVLRKDLMECGFQPEDGDTLNDYLIRIVNQSKGKPFIFIIDEWDAVIREATDNRDAQTAYLNLLRGWFKNTNFTPKVVAAAYMTGILPIKKDGSQSAISEFDESSMLDTLEFAAFVGFTEDEVAERCRERNADFAEIKAWYDGYDLPAVGSVYNPYSVMKALKSGKCQSYWRKTSAAESLKNYINMDFEGLQETVARLIAGHGDAVAAALDQIRGEQYAPQFYNNEQSLRAIIKYAYFVAAGQYVKIEEMPGGKGIADMAFLPTSLSRLPAMVVELKWNRTAGGAISQIREKRYDAVLKPYAGKMVLVGINYDEKTGKHSCRIEKA